MLDVGSFQSVGDERLKVLLIDDHLDWGVETLGSQLGRLFSVHTVRNPVAIWELLNDDNQNSLYREMSTGDQYCFGRQPFDIVLADFDIGDRYREAVQEAGKHPELDADDCGRACRANAGGFIAGVLIALAFPNHPCAVLPYSKDPRNGESEASLLKLLAPSSVYVGGIGDAPNKGAEWATLELAASSYRHALREGYRSRRLYVDRDSIEEVIRQVSENRNFWLEDTVIKYRVDGWWRAVSCQSLFLDYRTCFLAGEHQICAIDTEGTESVLSYLASLLKVDNCYEISRLYADEGWSRFDCHASRFRYELYRMFLAHGSPEDQPGTGNEHYMGFRKDIKEYLKTHGYRIAPDGTKEKCELDKATREAHFSYPYFFLEVDQQRQRESAIGTVMLLTRYLIYHAPINPSRLELLRLFDPLPETDHWWNLDGKKRLQTISRQCGRVTGGGNEKMGLPFSHLFPENWNRLREFLDESEMEMVRTYAMSLDPTTTKWPGFLQV